MSFRCARDSVFHDCQATALLALGRVLATFNFKEFRLGVSVEALLEAVDLGFDAIKIVDPTERKWDLDPIPPVVLMEADDDFRWGFKCGLWLRAIANIPAIEIRIGYPPLSEGSLRKAEFVNATCRQYILKSVKDYPDEEMKEIRTSFWSAETNTESQPWMTLGLFGESVEKMLW